MRSAIIIFVILFVAYYVEGRRFGVWPWVGEPVSHVLFWSLLGTVVVMVYRLYVYRKRRNILKDWKASIGAYWAGGDAALVGFGFGYAGAYWMPGSLAVLKPVFTYGGIVLALSGVFIVWYYLLYPIINPATIEATKPREPRHNKRKRILRHKKR